MYIVGYNVYDMTYLTFYLTTMQHHLHCLFQDFRNHATSAKGPLGGPVIPVREIDQILKYLPLLQNFSEELLRDLKARMEKWLVIMQSIENIRKVKHVDISGV
jgi:hypothetical protein